MSKCRRYEKRKIINIILENHFEKFKEDKLPRIKSKEMRQHIINVIEKAAENVFMPIIKLWKYRAWIYKT